MNKCFKILIISLILIISFASISYGQLYVQEPGIMPLNLSTIGLGGAYIAVADDYDVMFHNPAGLAVYESFSVPLFSVATVVGDLNNPLITDIMKDDAGNLTFDFTKILENIQALAPDPNDINGYIADMVPKLVQTKIGVGLAPSVNAGVVFKHFGIRLYDYSSVNLKFHRVGYTLETDIMAYADAGIVAGAGFKFGKYFSVGFNLKYVMRVMVARDRMGFSTLLSLADADILNAINNLGLAKMGHGIGSDLGFLMEFGKFKIGITITDWWGGTYIMYSPVNAYKPLEPTEEDKSMYAKIPTAINAGFSVHFDKIFMPKTIVSDVTIALDIRDILVFNFTSGEPSFDKTFFRNIYMGIQMKLFDIPVVRNIVLLPLKLGVGFYQGNISFSLQGKFLWLFDLGIAVWGEERYDRVGIDRVYNFAFVLSFGF